MPDKPVTYTCKDRPDFSAPSVRRKLPPRRAPYFYLTSVGRALGYQKLSQYESYWVARARNLKGQYIYTRIGHVDDFRRADGDKRLSFKQALEAANRWFENSPKRKEFSAPHEFDHASDQISVPDGPAYTVAHAMRDYVTWKKMSISANWVANMIQAINFHIISRIGETPVADFSNEDYQRFVRSIIETPAGRYARRDGIRLDMNTLDAETIRRKRNRVNAISNMLRDALKMAWENGKTSNNRAWRIVRRLRVSARPRIVYLNRAECHRLLEHCPSDVRRLVLGALYTGCRSSELLKMNVQDVAREGYGVVVQASKGPKSRFVFLPDEGMAFFLKLVKGKTGGDPLFPKDNSTKGRMRADFRYRFKNAVKEAGLPDAFSFHGLRHTYASQLVAAGAPLKVISDQLGHVDVSMISQIYGHLAPQIRESEVRQRFEIVSPDNAALANKSKASLNRLRKSLYGDDWRQYAVISKTPNNRADSRRVRVG